MTAKYLHISPESSPEEDILNILLYFDIFDHPLTREELQNFAKMPPHKINEGISKLESEGKIEKNRGYFSLPDKNWTAEQRIAEQNRINRYFKISQWITRLTSRFPFVRGIFISGSLSKHRANKESDIDFFIVTAPGRLWIARTLLILFKKVFLFNSYKYFCLNYFVDENSLEVLSKNHYSATETATIVPVFNYELYQRFMDKNAWIHNYFPYAKKRDSGYVVTNGGKIQRLLELFLKPAFFNKLDDFFMHITANHRKKKFHHMNPDAFQKAFYTEKNRSKHHPTDFQVIVQEAFERKKAEYFQKAPEHQKASSYK